MHIYQTKEYATFKIKRKKSRDMKKKCSTHLLIATHKGQTFLFKLSNIPVNQNWGKNEIFGKYKGNVIFAA